MTERILMNEFRALSREKWVNIDLHNEDIYKWDIALIVLNKDSMYYGGYFKALMNFPANYPYSPPSFRFTAPLFHPNVYEDGRVCISILHPPGEDEMSGETAAERWSPAQRVESVLISILSLLDDPEVSSPANVDAGVMLRNKPDSYRQIVKGNIEAARKSAPPGFEMPDLETRPVEAEKEDPDFWLESGGESDFGDFCASDSDGDLDLDQSSVSGSEDGMVDDD